MEDEPLDRHNDRKRNYMDDNDKSRTEGRDSEPPDTSTPAGMKELEEQVISSLNALIDDELDYPVYWRLPDGRRVLI